VVVAIAAVVIGVWALAQVAIIFVPDYTPPAELHLVAMTVLAAVFGLQRSGESKDDGKDGGKGSGKAVEPPPPPEPEKPEPLPFGRESAADLIARLRDERRSERP